MAKGLVVRHTCDCGYAANISKIVAARRNGTRCPNCGRNMQPTEEGWKRFAEAESAKRREVIHGIKKIPIESLSKGRTSEAQIWKDTEGTFYTSLDVLTWILQQSDFPRYNTVEDLENRVRVGMRIECSGIRFLRFE